MECDAIQSLTNFPVFFISILFPIRTPILKVQAIRFLRNVAKISTDTLGIQDVCFFEMSVNVYQAMWRHTHRGNIFIFLSRKSQIAQKEVRKKERIIIRIRMNSHTRHDFRRIVPLELYNCITLRGETWLCILHANSF